MSTDPPTRTDSGIYQVWFKQKYWVAQTHPIATDLQYKAKIVRYAIDCQGRALRIEIARFVDLSGGEGITVPAPASMAWETAIPETQFGLMVSNVCDRR